MEGLESWHMYRHFSQYGWMDMVLKTRIQDFGLSLEQFVIEYDGAEEEAEKLIRTSTEGVFVKLAESGGFEYALWGKKYTVGSLVMMHDAFDHMAERYPKKAEAIADTRKKRVCEETLDKASEGCYDNITIMIIVIYI